MAMIDTVQKAPFGAITTYRITRALQSAMSSLAAKRPAIAAMTPAEFEDIGLLSPSIEADRPGIVTRAVVWVREKIEDQRAAAALARLSPEMLDDIGMSEGDVARYGRRASFF